jgi:hypothetical protein
MLKDSITMAEHASGRKLKRAEVSRFWSEKANDYIHTHFTDWLKLMGVKFGNFWSSFQYDDLSLITLFDEDGVLTPGLRFGLVAALALPGMLLGAWKYPRSRWVVAAVFLHMAALMPVFVTERYRLAAVPGLILMAVAGLWELWQLLLSARWGNAAVYVTGTAMSVLFVAQPPGDVGLWSLDYYNNGLKLTELGQEKDAQGNSQGAQEEFKKARRNLETAFEYVQTNAEMNFALGNVFYQQGDRTVAKKFYRRAIDLNERHSGAYNNLGVMAMEEKRWQLAAIFFTSSLEIEPGDAKTHYLLAETKLELNNPAGAEKEIEAALKLKPDQKEFQALEQAIHAKLQPAK